MKFKSILAAIALVACGSATAQNATKADLPKLESQVNALSQKVAQLETNLERVITENVNLVEQLNVKTVTSAVDKKGIQWDIVKVEPNPSTNEVLLTLRITNNTGVKTELHVMPSYSYAVDSNSNQSNNTYKIGNGRSFYAEHGIPVNTTVTIFGVPVTSSYLSLVQLGYGLNGIPVKFTGVHIPW